MTGVPTAPTGVVITAAGGAGTIEIIRSLAALGGYRVVAVDASRHAGGFAFAHASYVVPVASAPEYVAAMDAVIHREQPEFVVPLVDEEIAVLHRLLTRRQRCRVLAPVVEFCEMANDKWHTFLALQSAGLPTARTWLAGDAGAATFPAIIKPRFGRGSRGIARLADPAELSTYLGRADAPADGFVIQEQVIGREYTVSVVVALGGPTLAVVPKEVVVKRGITEVGVTRIAPRLDAVCRLIQDRLHADGPFNVQFIVDGEGAPRVIEINPRYSTTVALTIAAGLNEVDVVIRQACGHAVGPLAFQPDLMMIRHPAQVYVREGDWHPESVPAEVVAVGR